MAYSLISKNSIDKQETLNLIKKVCEKKDIKLSITKNSSLEERTEIYI